MFIYPSAEFVYNFFWDLLDPFLPRARAEYSPAFWDAFELCPMEHDTSQGFVGLICSKQYPSMKAFYKISRFEDQLVEREYHAMSTLTTKYGSVLPFFPRVYTIVVHRYELNGKYAYKSMLISEYIPSLCSLSHFVERQGDPDLTIHLARQVFLTISVLREMQISHYDLHTDNILVRKCPSNLVLKYGDKDMPTCGYVAVIVDFGFCFAPALQTPRKFIHTLEVADKGYLTDRFSEYADYTRFCHSLAKDIGRRSASVRMRLIKKTLLKLFSGCKVDPKTGWDVLDTSSIYLQFFTLVERKCPTTGILFKQGHDWVAALEPGFECGGLEIEIPYRDIDAFFKEWSAVEERVTSCELLLYFFSRLVHHVLTLNSVHEVKSAFIDDFCAIVSFFVPGLNYELLVTSLRRMVKGAATFSFRRMQELEREYKERYKHVKLTDEDLWNLLSPKRGVAGAVEYYVLN
jgi:hypothetical protein